MTKPHITAEAAWILLLRHKSAQARIAKELGITPGAVSQWRRVPVNRVTVVAAVLGVPISEVRPDLAVVFGGSV